jgi:hypothetical protein
MPEFELATIEAIVEEARNGAVRLQIRPQRVCDACFAFTSRMALSMVRHTVR